MEHPVSNDCPACDGEGATYHFDDGELLPAMEPCSACVGTGLRRRLPAVVSRRNLGSGRLGGLGELHVSQNSREWWAREQPALRSASG